MSLKAKKYKRALFVCVLFIFAWSPMIAQNNKNEAFPKSKIPRGLFLEDSIQVGLPVWYSLAYSHPSDEQALFPDSSYNFEPFELIERKFFNTKTLQNNSFDSVVYQLVSYEIQPVQKLSLPVFVVMSRDCTAIYSTADSVILQELVKEPVEKQQPKSLSRYEEDAPLFNYPYLIAFLALLVFFALIFWRLFGKRIKKLYLLFQNRTRHLIFLNEYNRLTNRVTMRKAYEDIEKAVGLWKKHLEYFENKPISSYTSKEISQLIPEESLISSLKNLDKAIYGKEVTLDIENSFQVLRNFTITRFERKKEEIKMQ